MPVQGKSPVIPSLRYRDAAAAIDWLCRVLGFSRHFVVQGRGETPLPTLSWRLVTA